MALDIKTTKTVRNSFTVTLTKDDVVALLSGATTSPCLDIPKNALVYVVVPGGGDWSNTELPIDKDAPLTITWSVTKTEEY